MILNAFMGTGRMIAGFLFWKRLSGNKNFKGRDILWKKSIM